MKKNSIVISVLVSVIVSFSVSAVMYKRATKEVAKLRYEQCLLLYGQGDIAYQECECIRPK